MKQMKLLALSLILAVFALVYAPVVTAYAEESDTDYSDQYVVLSLEGFTIGQGYYIEPTKLSYEEIAAVWADEGYQLDLENLTAAQATYAFFVNAGLETTPGGASAYDDSSFYLEEILDIDKGEANIPEYITEAYSRVNGSDLVIDANEDTNLGEFDYTYYSGWMYTVDNEMPNVGASNYVLTPSADDSNTYVIRWQFTVAGYGADLGYAWLVDDTYYETADRTEFYIYYADNAASVKADATAKASFLEVMTDLTATSEDLAYAIRTYFGKTATITMNSTAPTITVTDADGNVLDIGSPTSYVYTTKLLPDTYTITAYGTDGETILGTIELVITDEDSQTFKLWVLTNIYVKNSDWVEGEDYTLSVNVMSKYKVNRNATLGTTVGSTRHAALCYNGDTIFVTGTPIGDKVEDYIETTVNATFTANVASSSTFMFNIAHGYYSYITVPEGSTVKTGVLKSGTYYVYTYLDTEKISCIEDGYESYKAWWGEGLTYYVRVSNPDGVTYWNWYTAAANDSDGNSKNVYTITKSDLYMDDTSKNSDTVIYDFSENVYDVADIYSNVNAQSYVSLSTGDTYQLECFRNWQAIEGSSNAQIAEADYHYAVIDVNGNASSDVITISTDENNSGIANISAVGSGTAIILVTYDAMTNMAGYSGYTFYSAIWPENTLVIVVTVDKDGTAIKTGMTINEDFVVNDTTKVEGDGIDAQLDVLYYLSGTDGAEYTFTPESGVTVTVARPVIADGELNFEGFATSGVTKNSDGSYTVSGLVTGSNIIKLTKNGVSTYQIIRAKEVAVSYTDTSGNEIDPTTLKAGDTFNVVFGLVNASGKSYAGIYHSANKFAGVYNMSAYLYMKDNLGTEYQGSGNQYVFASTASCQTLAITIPEYYTGTEFSLEGCVYVNGYGSYYGVHRTMVNYEDGTMRDFIAVQYGVYLGSLPDITLELAESDFVEVSLAVCDKSTGEELTGYSITVTGESGNETSVVNGVFYAHAGETCSYSVECDGYVCLLGEVDITSKSDTDSVTIYLESLPEGAWNGKTATEPATDENGVYLISNGAELYWFTCAVNGGSTSISGTLTADIDLANYLWTPIGSSSYKYTGTFDGAGYTVSNMRIDTTSSYAGFFGYTSAATVKNVTVEGTIDFTNTYAGGIVGYAAAGSTITNCISYVDISYTSTTSTSRYVGGIVGWLAGSSSGASTISNCINYGDVDGASALRVGGIVGAFTTTYNTISSCTNYGNVSGNNYVGGIVGALQSTSTVVSKVTNCYNAGTVTGSNSYVGGIFGYGYGSATATKQPTVTSCYNAGAVLGDALADTCDLYGFANATYKVAISDCYYSSSSSEVSDLASYGTYVSGSSIAYVKALTVETVSKQKDADYINEIADFMEYFEGLTLSDEDQAFVELYNKLKLAVADMATVTVAVYNYQNGEDDAVVLSSAKVEATSAVEAIKTYLEEKGASYTYEDGAFTEINGISGGWYLCYNDDEFDNTNIENVKIKDNDILELHYGDTAAAVAASYAPLGFASLTIGDYLCTFTWDEYDQYYFNGESLYQGSGQEGDPYVLELYMLSDTDLTALDVSYETSAASHYVSVYCDSIGCFDDYPEEDVVQINLDQTYVDIYVSTPSGRAVYYRLIAYAVVEKYIDDSLTTVIIGDATYTGGEVTPEVQVYVSNCLISEDCYELEFSNNEAVGTATVTVTGIGEYSGSATFEFEITKANQEVTNVPEDITCVYAEGTIYTLGASAGSNITYSSSNENVAVINGEMLIIVGIGEATITITAEENSNYYEATASFTVTVTGDLSAATIADISDQTYTGSAIKPSITVTCYGAELTEDTDYTVTYSKNTSVGKATVKVTGTGSFSGTVSTTFVIVKASQEIALDAASYTVTEGDEAFVVSATGKGTIAFASSDESVVTVDSESGEVTIVGPGEATITITAAGTSNWEAAEATVTITVNAKEEEEDEEDDTPDNTDPDDAGTGNTDPDDAGTGNTDPDDGTTSGTTTSSSSNSGSTSSGSTSSSSSASTSNKSNTKTITYSYTLSADATVVVVADATYTGKKLTPAVTVVQSGSILDSSNYTVTYSNNKNAGTGKVTITGTGDYSGTVTATFTIAKATQAISAESIVTTLNSSLKLNVKAKGKVTYTSSNKKVATVGKTTGKMKNKKCGKVVITVKAKATSNYKAATAKITVTIKPSKVTVKSISSKKTKQLTLKWKKQAGATGYQITYSTSKSFASKKSVTVKGASKVSRTIKKLKKGKTYYVKVRAYKTINGKKVYGTYSKVVKVRVK